jgi:lipoate-protein ligase B
VGDALSIEWYGETPYADALALQHQAVADRLAGRTSDRLLLVEHPRVITLGRSTHRSHRLAEEGIELFEVGRGGDITYHAPGQLVGYPVLDLDALGRRDVHGHLRRLESALIEALDELGVPAKRVPGWTGVFVDRARSALRAGRERKIASIGVGVRRWVTFHGFALNVTIDLSGFDSIVPCGLPDVEMTSVAVELAREEGVARLEPAWIPALEVRVRQVVAESMRRHLEPEPS